MLLCITLLSFIACSKDSGSSGNQTEEQGSQEKVSINFYGWSETYNQELVDAFNASQDEIEVTFVEIPTNDYDTKMATLLAGRAGDIDVYAQKALSSIHTQYKNGFVEPLDSYIEKSNYDLNAIASSVDFMKSEGKMVALPFRFQAHYTYYNKKIFDQAGIPYPNTYVEKGEWTWDKFVEIGKALTDAVPDVYGALLFIWPGYQIFPHAQAGGEFIDDNGNIDLLREPLRTSMDVRKELEAHGALIPLKELRVSREHYSTIFYAGKTGMMIMGEWFPGFMQKGRDENLLQGYTWNDWALTRMPADTDEYTTIGAPVCAHVYSGSKKKDAAFTFLAWMSEADGGGKVMAKRGILPPAMNDDVKNILLSAFPDEESALYFTEDKPSFPAVPSNKYGSQIDQAISSTLDLYLYEGYTFDEYYAELEKKLQGIIDATK